MPIPGAPDEISMFMGVNYNQDHVRLARFAIRTDGFFSWRADYEPGKVVTKPFTFEGNTLEINFATSAFGYVRISLADENGAVIPGYEYGRLFGDSIDRCVDFEKPLGALAGRPVRMVVEMSDADFYSFRFVETPEVL